MPIGLVYDHLFHTVGGAEAGIASRHGLCVEAQLGVGPIDCQHSPQAC
jgi:hypothetical protein